MRGEPILPVVAVGKAGGAVDIGEIAQRARGCRFKRDDLVKILTARLRFREAAGDWQASRRDGAHK
jgi:hypothetical protein